MAYTTPEQRVQGALLEYLKRLEAQGYPIYCQRREAGGSTYRKGSADIFFVWGPYHVEVEVKAPGGSLSTMQEKWRDRMTLHGTPCWVIDDVGEFRRLIETTFMEKE